MLKNRKSLASRITAIFLTILIVFSMIPPITISARAAGDATIQSLVDGGTVSGNTVTFENMQLDWFEKNSAVGRTADGWWVGIRVDAPAGMSEQELKTSQYINASGTKKLFWDVKDSKEGDAVHYIELWGLVNEGRLNDAIINGTSLSYAYQFDWDADGVYEHPIEMIVNPEKITLKKDNVTVYPLVGQAMATVEAITSVIEISDNSSNIVTAANNARTELTWIAAGSVRPSDGWWIGIKVNAPAALKTQSDFANVTYQTNNGGTWSEAKSFWNNKDSNDTATSHNIQLWGLLNESYILNAVENNKAIRYSWRFDWNGDGVYEQLVQMNLDPSKIVLKDENGAQVYPYLGKVSPLTGGTVSGSTSDTKLVIDKTSLEWSEADESVGRYTSGWWVGMKVIAPESFSDDVLRNASYKRRVTSSTASSGWSDYTEIDFWSVKDTQDDAETHSVQMWMRVTQDLISKYENLGRNIATEYIFDWDGDGTDDQKIVMEVVPGADIVLNKVAQDDFAFVEPNPIDKWVGETYKNVAQGGAGTGAVTYSIIDGQDVADISQDGTLTFKKTGTVKVKAIKAEDDVYKQAEAEYTVKSIKYVQDKFSFENSNANITVEYSDKTFTNIASGGSGNGEIIYEIILGTDIASIDSDTGVVTFNKAGQITVVATKKADDNYLETTTTYALTITKSSQDTISFVDTPTEITYSKNKLNVISVSGGSGTGALRYSIASGNEFATIDSATGEITTLKAGGKITVEVYKLGDDCYEDTNKITKDITINYANQSTLYFAVPEPKDIVFNDNENVFINTVSGGTGTGIVSYELLNCEGVATIDENTGEVTILSAGTIEVKATKAGDTCYKETSATYTLTIGKDTPEFEVNDVELIYGTKQYQLSVKETLVGSGEYTYYISGENEIGAAIDENGKITFSDSDKKVGTVNISVKKEADSQYCELEKTIKLTVSYLETDAVPVFDGEQINDSGWYTDDITITAPEGYKISFSNELSNEIWEDVLTYDTEDNVGQINVYLKNGDGITDAVELSGLLLDKTNPDNLSVAYTTPDWERTLEVLTLGYYKTTKVIVTLSAKDTGSGIETFTYNYGTNKSETKDFIKESDGTVKYSFEISSDFRDMVNFSVIDQAGRETSLIDNKVLVVDHTAPELKVLYDYEGESYEEDDIIYTNNKVTARFEIKENNFDLSLINDADKPVVELDGNPVLMSWTKDSVNDVWVSECKINTEGEHNLSFKYTDLFNNETVEYTKEIRVDLTAPIVKIDYEGTSVKENIYNPKRIGKLIVIERNFKASDVELSIEAVDINDNTVDISSKKYADYVKDENNWSSKDNIHSLVLPDFDINGIYTVNVSYSDKAKNAAVEYETDNFIIDAETPKNAGEPNDVVITYSESILEKTIEKISFGFYQASATVTVTVKDDFSGIETFDIIYNSNDGKNNANKPSYTAEKLVAVQDTNDKSVFTATHVIDADARGTVSVKISDKAENMITVADDKVLVVDDTPPELDVFYTFTDNQSVEYNGELFTKGATQIKFIVEESNFDVSTEPEVTVNEEEKEVEWTQVEGADKWVGIIEIEGDGDYNIGITYADSSGKEMETYTKTLHIDNTKPIIDVSYNNNEALNTNNYNAARTATVTITEHNFKADDVNLTVTAKDISGTEVDLFAKTYSDYVKNAENWTSKGDVHTLSLPAFDIDGRYEVYLDYTDIAENVADLYNTNFVVDKVDPKIVNVECSTPLIEKVIEKLSFGFYNAKVTVTVTAEDITSGVDFIDWKYYKQQGTSNENADNFEGRITSEYITYSPDSKTATAKFEIPANARGFVSVEVTDKAGRDNITTCDTVINVVDNVTPKISVKYVTDSENTKVQFTDKQNNTVDSFKDGVNAYYNGDVTARIVINEANFFEGTEADDGVIHNVGIKLRKTDNSGKVTVIEYLPEGSAQMYEDATAEYMEWTTSGDEHSFNINYQDDADYVLEIEYTDLSNNDASIESDDAEPVSQTYESKIVTVDKVNPIIEVAYDNNDVLNTNNYNADRVATVTVIEHNFRADDIKLKVTAEDITGGTLDLSAKAYTEYASNRNNWTSEGDVHTLVLPKFDIDGRYSAILDYEDLAENAAEGYEAHDVVDKTEPKITNVEYRESIIGKIVEKLSYGFYQSKVTVIVTAEDITAGVDYIEWKYNKQQGTSDKNAEDSGGTIISKNIAYSDGGKTATAKFEIPANARGFVSVNVTDKAGNDYGESYETVISVVDNIAPEVTVKYLADSEETKVQFTDDNNNTVDNFKDGVNAYYNGNVTAKIIINEANFFEGVEADDGVIHNVGIKLVKTDNLGNKTVTEYLPEGAVQKYADATAEYITWLSVDDEHSFNINYQDDADYVLEIEYTDLSQNDSKIESDDTETVSKKYESKIVTVDKTLPDIVVVYNNNNALNSNNYKADRISTVTVTEHNFRADDIKLTVTSEDITGDAVDLLAKSYTEYARNRNNWKSEGDTHTIVLPTFDIDGRYYVTLSYEDLAENEAESYYNNFVIDKTDPEKINIEYSTPIISKVIEKLTFGYYKSKVKVTVTAEDITSGVDCIDWKYNKQSGASDKNSADYEGSIKTDELKYSADNKTVTASFEIPANARGFISAKVTDKAGNYSKFTDTDNILIVDTIAPTRVVKYSPERILDAKTLTDVSSFEEKDEVVLYYKKSAVVTFEINEANFYPEDVVIKVNGEEIVPSDWKKNGDVWAGTITVSGDGDYIVTMNYTDRSTNKMVSYKSQKIAIDSTVPTIEVEYDNNESLNENNYSENRTAKITIIEHNFRADDVNAVITANDIQGNNVSVTDYAAYLSDKSNWKTDGDVHIATITYSTDAIYTFDVSYSDIIGNDAVDFKKQKFVIDHNAPVDLDISYSESVISKVLKAITFGFYKEKVKVTLTADDISSGVDYFEWVYTVQESVSDKNVVSLNNTIKKRNIFYENDGMTAVATFEIPANARGSIYAKVVDKAGNSASKTDGNVISVVDNIAPTVSINYNAVDENTKVQFVDGKNNTVADFESAVVAYYNGDATAKVVINEANFFEGKKAKDGVIHQVGVKLTAKFNDGTSKVTEFLPKGAEQMYPDAEAQYIVWENSGDEHSFTIDYTENADYVLEIEYSDLSENSAEISANDGKNDLKTYKSKIVCIDKIAPVVSVVYGNVNPVNTIDSCDYFDSQQTAVITVNEHNFRAEDFIVSITAKDIVGNNVKVENYKTLLSKQSSWTKDGNTYTAEIEYSTDANYIFDFEYCDLALNDADDYQADKFTVDTKAPEKLEISYSKSVLDKVLNFITFGYYNSKVTVTITAQDDISGVNEFLYSYINQEGVSKVNAELFNRKIKDANENIKYDGKKSIAKFTIPESTLSSLKQFNGSVNFKAFDRSENVSEKLDTQVLVVDNIRPTVKVTYNEPVKQINGISYYAGNIEAQIIITEANFYKQDVVVLVTKDGSTYPVNVTWSDVDTDIHCGSFVLTEDGDYTVSIRYSDRSENEMDTYTSNQLTIDTKTPVINITNIVANSANKDEFIGFTVVATDTNFDADSLKPVLEATMRDENGSYVIKRISLGSVRTVESGKTYTYVVENLEDDAVYTLTCEAADMSGNRYSRMRLEDGREYESVQFSVNRNGSVFTADSLTNKLVDKYFVYSIDDDIVIEEINVDAIEKYQVELNGRVLVEGKDFKSSLVDNNGEWSKRIYSISKSLFESEGEYSIVIKSTDKTDTTAYSDVKNLNISFVVDQTAPVLTISGLKDNGRYQVEEQTVTVIPTDDGGRLSAMRVIVLDSDGEPIKSVDGKDVSVRFDMSGEEFLKYLAENDGVITFTIPEGLENQVQIICNDCALNADDETNEYNTTFKNVTVSASGWIIFYANKPLFFGTIAAVASPIVAFIIFLIYKKKKRT